MKTLRKMTAAALLACALALPVIAGDMHAGGNANPSPTPPQPTGAAEVLTEPTLEVDETSGAALEVVAALVQSVLSVF